MNFKIIDLFIMVGLFVMLWLLVYFKREKRTVGTVFNIFVVNMALWAFGLAMFYKSSSPATALFWTNVLYLAGSLIASAFLLLSFVFPAGEFTIPLFKRFLIFVPNALLFVLFFFTPIIVKEVAVINGAKGFVYGPGHVIWDIQFDVIFAWGFLRFLRVYKKSTGIIRARLRYIILGTLVGVVLAGTTNVIMPWFNKFDLLWLGPTLTLTWLVSIVYAIIKYRLMDIELVFRDIALFLPYFLTAAVVFIPLIILPVIFGGKSFLWLSSVFVVLLIIISPFLHKLLIHGRPGGLVQKAIKWIDKRLFKGKFSYFSALTDFWEKKGVIYTSSQLAWALVREITELMNLESCSFLMFKRSKKEFVPSAYVGLDEIFGHIENFPLTTIEPYSPFIRYLIRKKEVIIREELENSTDEQIRQTASVMRKIGAHVSVPIFVANRLTAVLNMGIKKTEDMFSNRDIKMLEELVHITENHLSHTVFLENSIFFSGNVAHDIRAPFRDGLIYEYLNDIYDGHLTAAQKKAVEELEQLIENTHDKIDVMLDIHTSLKKFVTGEFKPQRIDYAKKITDVSKYYVRQARERGIAFEILIPEKKFDVYAEPMDVDRILKEVLANALKYTDKGKIIIKVHQENPEEVLTQIRDTGCGICEEDLEGIWEPFKRVENNIKREGAGIGLASILQLIDANGGRIWVKSKKGEGSTFYFILPCVEIEREA